MMAIAPSLPGRPDICVCRSAEGTDEAYRAVCLGMEEEGVPWHDGHETSGSATELAFSAANEGRLEVGIGISPTEVVLHFAKLAPDKPLFRIRADSGYENVRALGSNAARLVKKIPFKPLETA